HRFVALKLLENDSLIVSEIKSSTLLSLAEELRKELEAIHGEQAETVIISERYSVASRIAEAVTRKKETFKGDFTDKIDNLLLHQVGGYLLLVFLLLIIFFIIFKFGSFLSEEISLLFNPLIQYLENLPLPPFLSGLLVHGLIEGIIAGLAIVLPYIAPFYFLLSVLEDTGYLARIAFLTDFLMHKLGVHGKAFIPLIESFGCNVPAILGTRVMERKRDRLITSILATLIPCSARSVIIFGLVAVFLGPLYALLLYLIDFLLIFLVGLLLNRYLKGLPSGLIMEMPRFRKPVLRIILRQTWIRLKDFTNFALPIIVGANLVMETLVLTNSVEPISRFFAPISWFLGLPAFATVALLFGFLRKELTLTMLATFYGTTNFGAILTGKQIFIFGLVTMIYIPCVATIAAPKREFGMTKALMITLGEIFGAIIIGGLLNLILRAFG
ncbi:MAG: nucleoside recognition domain-containing protein, partial [bacterium]